MGNKKPNPVLVCGGLEVVLSTIVSGLLAENSASGGFLGDPHKIHVLYMTCFGFLLISLVTTIAFFVSEPTPPKQRLMFAVSGIVLWICSGAFILETNLKSDRVIATGSLAIINAVVYIVDAYFTYKNLK